VFVGDQNSEEHEPQHILFISVDKEICAILQKSRLSSIFLNHAVTDKQPEHERTRNLPRAAVTRDSQIFSTAMGDGLFEALAIWAGFRARMVIC
jgi:hypothetical protein